MAWPNVPVPPTGEQGWQVLSEIVFKACGRAPNFDLIVYLALKCSANPNHVADAVHIQHVTAARLAADKGWWNVVANELDHDD